MDYPLNCLLSSRCASVAAPGGQALVVQCAEPNTRVAGVACQVSSLVERCQARHVPKKIVSHRRPIPQCFYCYRLCDQYKSPPPLGHPITAPPVGIDDRPSE